MFNWILFYVILYIFYVILKFCTNTSFSQVISADNLAKKDIFGASDPYVRIDLVSNNGEEVNKYLILVYSKTYHELFF